jgi:uncharacterized membrane protein
VFQETNRKIHDISYKASLKDIIFIVIPVAVFTLSILYWGNILWLKYNSLHDYVFDSGVFLDSLYQIFYFHSTSTIVSYTGSSPDRIIFSPLSIFHSILLLLYIQLIAVLGSSFIICYTLKKLTGNSVISSIVSVLYLIYFPIDGSLFFDVHAQTFFIPFFLLGFMFQVMNRKYLSIIFFLLAGMTRFPLIGIVVLYSILDFIRNFRINRGLSNINKYKSLLNFDMILFAFSFILLLFEYIIEHDYYGVQVVSSGYLHVQSSGILSNLSTKVITILFFTAPFLFLILYANEFSLILWGLFGFIFYANYTPYYYPGIFSDQYSSIFVGVIFLILMVYLGEYYQKRSKELTLPIKKTRLKRIKKSPLTKIVIAVVLFAILLEPVSPLSSDMGTHFNVQSYTTFGNSNNTAVMQLAYLMPSNSSGVLIQNDLPQILTYDRNINPNLIGEVLGYPSNYTVSFFKNSTSIDYIYGYLDSSSFSYSNSGLTQYNIIQNALSSGKYSIVGENGELILLKRSFHGLPEFFSNGEIISIQQKELINIVNPKDYNQTMDSANNKLYYNNYFYLLPGTYELNLTLSQLSSNLSANLNFQIYGKQLGKDDLNKTFQINNGKNYVSFEFSISNVYMTRYLSVSALNITGQIRLNSIMIKQLN